MSELIFPTETPVLRGVRDTPMRWAHKRGKATLQVLLDGKPLSLDFEPEQAEEWGRQAIQEAARARDEAGKVGE